MVWRQGWLPGIDRDRGWNEGIAASAGLEPLFPVWSELDGPVFRKRLEIIAWDLVLQAGLWSMDIRECRLVQKEHLSSLPNR